jgi:hypothetical protein
MPVPKMVKNGLNSVLDVSAVFERAAPSVVLMKDMKMFGYA